MADHAERIAEGVAKLINLIAVGVEEDAAIAQEALAAAFRAALPAAPVVPQEEPTPRLREREDVFDDYSGPDRGETPPLAAEEAPEGGVYCPRCSEGEGRAIRHAESACTPSAPPWRPNASAPPLPAPEPGGTEGEDEFLGGAGGPPATFRLQGPPEWGVYLGALAIAGCRTPAWADRIADALTREAARQREGEPHPGAAHVVAKSREGGGRDELPHFYLAGPRRESRVEALADLARWEALESGGESAAPPEGEQPFRVERDGKRFVVRTWTGEGVESHEPPKSGESSAIAGAAQLNRICLAWAARSAPAAPAPAAPSSAEPWPIRDAVARLATAANHLLAEHDCDHHGYEELTAAADAADRWLNQLAPAAPCGIPWGIHRPGGCEEAPAPAAEGAEPYTVADRFIQHLADLEPENTGAIVVLEEAMKREEIPGFNELYVATERELRCALEVAMEQAREEATPPAAPPPAADRELRRAAAVTVESAEPLTDARRGSVYQVSRSALDRLRAELGRSLASAAPARQEERT